MYTRGVGERENKVMLGAAATTTRGSCAEAGCVKGARHKGDLNFTRDKLLRARKCDVGKSVAMRAWEIVELCNCRTYVIWEILFRG